MFEDYVPKKKIGYLSPLGVIDNGPFEFYLAAPKGVMLVMIPVGVQEFTKEDVERAFSTLDRDLDQLMERGVDVVLQAGVPLPLLVGPEYIDWLLEHIRERTKVLAASTVYCVVAAAKHLGLKKIVAANKWNSKMNETLKQFFAGGGVNMIGTHSRSMVPSEFVKMSDQASIDLAYDLGRGALESFPEADAVYIGGGSWLTLPVITQLEDQFKKPVITNHISVIWDLCHQLRCWSPRAGFGTLLESN
jgi:maleate cis-trans isomerase